MNTKRPAKTWFIVFISIGIQFLQPNAPAAEIDFVRNVKNADVEFILKADEVKKIAGLKISVSYPDQLITYIDSVKSAETSSFMHVVNDKNPGKLIIVMASARGISGENIPLLSLRFKPRKIDQKLPLVITATQCQLMDESLNEIKCSIKQIQANRDQSPMVQEPKLKAKE